MEKKRGITEDIAELESFRRLHGCHSRRILGQIADRLEQGCREKDIPGGEKALAGIRSWIADENQGCNHSAD